VLGGPKLSNFKIGGQIQQNDENRGTNVLVFLAECECDRSEMDVSCGVGALFTGGGGASDRVGLRLQ
jgi:hypothetical protein